jgi:tetratricopeptide (TPR) repeat protein
MNKLTLCLSGLLLLGLCGTASADSIRLRGGSRIEGQATAYDTTTKVLSWRDETGRVRDLKLEELDSRSAYRVLKSQVAKDNGPGQLQLANFARDIELFAHAVRHYGYAEKADLALKDQVEAELVTLRSRAAKWAMNQAQECKQKGDIKGAEKWLEKIITKLPEEPAAAEAQKLIDDYYARVHTERTQAAEAEAQDLLRSELAGAKKSYDSMLAKNQKALKEPRGGSPSVKGWESAIKDGEKALDKLDMFIKANPGVQTEALGQYRSAIVEHLSEIYLHLANHWATRTSYNKALVQVNAVLAMDSKNEQALSMRNRIQDAASRGLRWLW